MPATHRIKGDELPSSLQNKFNVKAHQFLTITVKIEEEEERTEDFDCENYDLNEALKQSLLEVEAHMKGEIELKPL